MITSRICRGTFPILPLLVVFGLLCPPEFATGQIGDMLSSVTEGAAKEGEPLAITAELVQSGVVSGITLAYRQYGQTEFKQRDMDLAGTTATTTIPGAEVTPPLVEYYLVLEMDDGTMETYPLENPEGNPRQVAVATISPKGKEVLILSPEPNQQVSLGDFVVSVSLIRAPDKVDKSATRLYLDNEDVTQYAVILEDLIVFYPDNYPSKLRVGSHTVRIDIFDAEGDPYHSVSWDFSVTTAELAAALSRNRVDYRLTFQGEARNEEVSSVNTWHNQFTTKLNAAYRSLRFNGMAKLTSEERGERQPQHRFFANLETSWLRLQGGDIYPKFPSLILRGKRVRGFNGSLMLGFFNLDYTTGKIVRSVEGKLLRVVPKDSVTATGIFIERPDGNYSEVDQLATFQRTLFAIRPSFGGGENFQFGITYLHSEDDVESVELGLRPRENVVVGPDLLIGFNNQRFLLTAQAAVSVVNNDISGGTLTDEEIEALAVEFDAEAEDIKDIRDLIDRFITFNQYISPINPDELSSVAGEVKLRLNYFGNFFKGSYIYRGNEYQSFGQTFLRKDIKGFNFLDRIRLFKNRFFVTVGYERLEDNLQDTKPATTTLKNTNISLSLYPRTNFPNITVGYARYDNDNELAVVGVDSANAIKDKTNRLFGQLSYDFTAGIRHSANLNFSTSDRDDETFRQADVKTTTVGFQLNSTWTAPLTTSLGISLNQNEISGSAFDYTTVLLSGRYRFLADKLLLSASFNPTFGDFQRQVLVGGLQFFVTRKFSFVFNVRYFNNEEPASDDIITGVTTRIEL